MLKPFAQTDHIVLRKTEPRIKRRGGDVGAPHLRRNFFGQSATRKIHSASLLNTRPTPPRCNAGSTARSLIQPRCPLYPTITLPPIRFSHSAIKNHSGFTRSFRAMSLCGSFHGRTDPPIRHTAIPASASAG